MSARRGGSSDRTDPASWTGAKVRAARAYLRPRLPTPCARGCGTIVTTDTAWVVGHIKSRAAYPELTNDPSNWQVECRPCSDASAQQAVIEKARRDGERAARATDFPHQTPGAEPPPLPLHTQPAGASAGQPYPTSSWFTQGAATLPSWLQPLAAIPVDASAPLYMSPPHPRAVGSYGEEAAQWIDEELGVRLRWWQRLALVRQLEHDDAGELCWATVWESAPRRSGKSVRIRTLALWRISHPALFGEPQLVLHTGRDLPIAREIHQRAWSWVDTCRNEAGWRVKRGMGNEEIVTGDEDRWLVRSVNGVYGYDVSVGAVDEAWDVEPRVVDEGLEPATLERASPQLHLTSTAHRRATSLMPKRLTAAVATEDAHDPDTLVLLWGASPDADPGDPETWRAASPHWTEHRRKLIASKYEKALAGEVDPEADDPDPMEGFRAQYLNVWRLALVRSSRKGAEVVDGDRWQLAALDSAPPQTSPDAVGVESWFNEGVSVARAWRDGERVVVAVTEVATVAAAAELAASFGCRAPVLVGASIADDPAWAAKHVRVRSVKGGTAEAAADLGRYLAEGVIAHFNEPSLTGQVLALRVTPSADGARLASTVRADAVKAAVRAVAAVRAQPARRRRLLVARAAS